MQPETDVQKQLKHIKLTLWSVIGVAAVLAAFIYFKSLPPPDGKYDALAQCIANTSTTFYGAIWCSHCREQKIEFGSAAQYLPYVECSLNPGQQYKICTDAGVKQYPTWHFPDGSTIVGEQSVETLSLKTGCPLPT